MTGPIDANIQRWVEEYITDMMFGVDRTQIRAEFDWLRRKLAEISWIAVNERVLARVDMYKIQHGDDETVRTTLEILARHNAFFDGRFDNAEHNPIGTYRIWLDRLIEELNARKLVKALDLRFYALDWSEPPLPPKPPSDD